MNFGRKGREADELVRPWLESSGIPVGGRLPSERELAGVLGIHHSLLNRVMARLLAEGRVERRGYKLFRAAGGEGGAPQSPCDLVILQRSKRLASLRKVAQELRIPLREHLAQSADELARHLSALESSSAESVVLVPPHGGETTGWEPAARRLAQTGLPVICVGQRVPGFPSVAGDRGLEQIFKRLAALGHFELALLAASPWTAAVEETTARWAALCQRFASESSRERVIFQNSSHLLKEDLLAIAEQLNAEWKPVTALVLSTDDELPIQRLLDVFRRHKIAVPGRLSLVSLFDHPALQTAAPPVAAALEDLAMEHEAAFGLAQRAVRKRLRLGQLAGATEIDIALDFKERSSLAPNFQAMPVSHPGAPVGGSANALPVLAFDQEDLGMAGKIPYDLVGKVDRPRFRSLSLAEKVNRPLNFRRGWLGDLPLGSLPPGMHTFHGVPFRVLGGPTRRDRGAIVFQSLRNSTGGTAKLPTKVRIPVNFRAKALYILHGCGYVKPLARFASYAFFQKKRALGTIPLVALGQPLPGAATWELAEAILEANIQDWWPDYPHCNFRQARMVPLADSRSAGPVRGHVYLYTIEWINPFPEIPISHIEIEADPAQSATLGVLAISVLLPGRAK